MNGDLPIGVTKNAKGTPELPQDRFKDAEQVREYCSNMVRADRRRASWRSAIDGLWSGNPVYSHAALRAKGQGYRARVNYRELEGLIQAQQTPFFDLVTSVDKCIDVDLDFGSSEDETAEMEDKICKAFTWLLQVRWRKGFNFHVPYQQLQMLKHGLGAHLWPTSGWIPRTPKSGHILFPDDCPVNFDEEGKSFMVRDYLTAEDIYAFIRNEKAAAALGWNVDSVWEALSNSSKARKYVAGGGTDIEQFRFEMSQGDMGTTTARQAGLWLNFLFYKEFDGTVSQALITEESGASKGYLFKKRSQFKEWPLTLFPYDIGDGTLQSIRGLGARTKDFFELNNRLYNSMADQVFLGSLLMFKGGTGIDPDKLRLMRLGHMAIVPQGLEQLTPFKFPDLSQGPMALSQMLKQTVASNNKSYMGGVPDPKDRETAQSFNLRAADSAQINNGAHSLYGSNLRDFYERILRKVIKSDGRDTPDAMMAKEFRDKVVKSGVPLEALGKITEVREVMSTGAGSAAARLHALMTLFQTIYPTTSPDRQINIERAITGALFPNGNMVELFARSLHDNDQPTNDDSMIAVENDVLARGGKAKVAPRQNQDNHIKGHLAEAQQIVQQVQQGQMDPQAALMAIQGIGHHTQDHLNQIEKNPLKKQEAYQARRELAALGSIADQLQQQISESQNQEPPQQKTSDTLQIGMAKVQADSQVKQAKLQADTQLKFRKAAVTERLQDIKTAAQLRRQTDQHQLTQRQKQLALTNGQ